MRPVLLLFYYCLCREYVCICEWRPLSTYTDSGAGSWDSWLYVCAQREFSKQQSMSHDPIPCYDGLVLTSVVSHTVIGWHRQLLFSMLCLADFAGAVVSQNCDWSALTWDVVSHTVIGRYWLSCLPRHNWLVFTELLSPMLWLGSIDWSVVSCAVIGWYGLSFFTYRDLHIRLSTQLIQWTEI